MPPASTAMHPSSRGSPRDSSPPILGRGRANAGAAFASNGASGSSSNAQGRRQDADPLQEGEAFRVLGGEEHDREVELREHDSNVVQSEGTRRRQSGKPSLPAMVKPSDDPEPKDLWATARQVDFYEALARRANAHHSANLGYWDAQYPGVPCPEEPRRISSSAEAAAVASAHSASGSGSGSSSRLPPENRLVLHSGRKRKR